MAKNQLLFERAMRFGQASVREERWAEAAQAFKIAIREMPHDPEPFAGLGDALMGQQQLAKALECYKLAGRKSQGDVRYLQRVADVQERMGHLQEASHTYMAVGEIYYRRHSLDEAIDNWQRAVRLEPGLLGAHHRLATVYQQQGSVKAAVREYLAIARTWKMRGDDEKALYFCRVALRLDPLNEDVKLAMTLIERGSAGIESLEETASTVTEPSPVPQTTVASTVRRMADVLAIEKGNWQPPRQKVVVGDPVTAARRLARNQLAEEIFREETDAELLYDRLSTGLSKLERDALIGQGMDFESRGHLSEAIDCYEKAIQGGLHLPAARFMVGMLYIDIHRYREARESLALAAVDPVYRRPASLALNQIAD